MKMLDLTHCITPEMPVYPGTEPPRLTAACTMEKDGFRAVSVTVTSRVGGMATVTGLSGRESLAGEGSFTLKAQLAKGEAEHGGH